MENKQTPSKKKLLSIQEEKLLREVDHGCVAGNSSRVQKRLFLDLEIQKKNPTQRLSSQRVVVSIKPRAPAIKTLYIAEKSRYHSKKVTSQFFSGPLIYTTLTNTKILQASDKSGSLSRLGIGDHSSFTTHFSDDDSNFIASIGCGALQEDVKSEVDLEKETTTTCQEDTTSISKCSEIAEEGNAVDEYSITKRLPEKCYFYTQPQITMNLPKIESKVEKSKVSLSKVDIGTYVVNPSSDDSLPFTFDTLNILSRRVDHLERRILRQEMVFRSIDPNVQLSSSDEECEHSKMRSMSGGSRPGCSYIQQYSHVPETSAFQRFAQQAAPLSPNKATNLEKEHNSEQYGRDFTAYDGITARGRRQCASVPCKRDDFPKMAAERVHKIRHKLNPVRDYRLMDTVHYLAQGEFAPRDDGIKLTPSREAVLSDIIWEDVCRTHWPNARLGRRGAQPDRCSTRCELQRLIDSLLRERVAHVERRRRRHYRIVKLNHRHESCRPVGKTGDIIVASHKNKEDDNREVPINDHNAASAMIADRRWDDQSAHRSHRSHDRLTYPDMRQKRRFRQEECSPGTSYATNHSPTNREPTICYQSSSKPDGNSLAGPKVTQHSKPVEIASASSSSCKPQSKSPRLVVKKEYSRRKQVKEEPHLEQYILLPTLVIRSPSNIWRQKKFNKLYHRILNGQYGTVEAGPVGSETVARKYNKKERESCNHNPDKKDIGFNINISVSESEEKMKTQRPMNNNNNS